MTKRRNKAATVGHRPRRRRTDAEIRKILYTKGLYAVAREQGWRL